MKTRKFVSNLLVAALATTPVALAAVANLKEKVSPGSVPYLVVGEKAAASDVLAAADLAFALAALSKKTETVEKEVELPETGEVLSGGIKVYKDTSKLYLDDSLNKAVPKIEFEEGKVEGDKDDYKYRVELWLGSNAVLKYMDPSDTDEKDPDVVLDAGSNPMFIVKVKFDPGDYLNLDDAKGAEIKVFGKTFYLDKDEDGNVVLRSSAAKITLNAGETYEFNGKKIKIEDIVKQGSDYYVKVSVDGTVETIKVKQDDEINGIYVYVKGAYVSELEEGKGYAELILGGEKVVLKDGDGIEVNGELDERVVPTISKDANGNIKEIDFAIYKSDDSSKNYVKEGAEFVPTLFDVYKLVFGKVDLEKGVKVDLSPSGDKEYRVSIVDWRGNSKTLTIAKLDSSDNVYLLEDSDKVAGTVIGVGSSLVSTAANRLNVGEDEYFAVFDSQTKESYLYKVEDINIDTANKKADVTLKDVVTGKSIKLEGIPYGDGTNTEDWSVGSFVLKVYVSDGNNKLVLGNVDTTDNSKYLEDEIKLYLKDEAILDIKQGDIDTGSAGEEVELKIYKKYPEVGVADTDVLVDMVIDNTTNDKVEVDKLEIYNRVGGNAGSKTSAVSASDTEDRYLSDVGIYVKKLKSDDGPDTVKVYIPSEVRWYDIRLYKAGEEVAQTTEGGEKVKVKVDVEKLVPIEPKFTLLDKEAAGKSGVFVLVGGPCANNLVETIAKEEGVVPTCSTWGTERKAVLARATSGGNEYFVVAGTEAIDTRIAAKVLAYYLEGKEIPEEVKTALESKDVVWLDTTKATLDNPTNVGVKE